MSRKKKKSKAKIWIIIAVVVVVGGLVTANILTKRGPKALNVDVAEAVTDSLVQKVTASGKIQPKTEVKISSNVSGQILYLGAEEGDRVSKGELLIRIEDEEYRADVEQMEYLLRSHEASLEENQSRLTRVTELAQNNLASRADLEAATAAVKRLEADVDRTRAQLNQTRDRFEKTRIHSPLDGIVTRLSKEVGEMAIGSQFSQDIIMIVSRLDSMEVIVEVNENDVVLVDLGDEVEVEVFAMPDTTFKAHVSEIAHSGTIRGSGSAEEVTNFMVTVAIDDFITDLRPGMSATVDIVTEKRPNAIVLPQEAVAVRLMSDEERHMERARSGEKKKKNEDEDDERQQMSRKGEREEPVEVVFVVKDDTVWAKQVTLGIYSDTQFEIISGLEVGEMVVTGPFRLLSRELHSGTVVEFKEPFKPDENIDPEANPDGEGGVQLAEDEEEEGASTEIETADAS
ncbi:MAG TPA: efflux RND transporter periplasmic adaptor subunit [Bacteroidetes bacterium]|nr:macrolide export protein MacA [bacterium BMS3Bbin04]HDO65915.1 efflux RND transporter periplasmic adaptor subunit [Bacteroidota bacterium]HEX05040.1 efflux RND transporter periplasmic adaptor subunit [Bacteroidota bacterium]